jgi:hypothetical protein
VNDDSGIWKLVIDDQLRPRVGFVSRMIGIAVALFMAFLFWRLQAHRKLGDAASKVSE